MTCSVTLPTATVCSQSGVHALRQYTRYPAAPGDGFQVSFASYPDGSRDSVGARRSLTTTGACGASASDAAAAALTRAFCARYGIETPSTVSFGLCCLAKFSLASVTRTAAKPCWLNAV